MGGDSATFLMTLAHLNPSEYVQAYREFVGVHPWIDEAALTLVVVWILGLATGRILVPLIRASKGKNNGKT